MRSIASRVTSDRGAAPAEWSLVAGLLTVLFLTVLQVGFVMHVRTTLIDAAAEGARVAGLRDSSAAAGAERTEQLVELALSPGYAESISVDVQGNLVEVRITAPLPLIGLLGFPDGMEVSAHAPIE
ncbi:TadE/TadG family type IV pilus assembly protein [Gulosibacter faecalis]|jgi:Flp pilus assembly protein TadG|uniref:TadE/TadG family type IV pilus assembly protein n=1 Tax=Gulosibacter faecalis TaxID=272240 RepID=A0ABW5V1C2_9MICO|nr:TadE/TadG family type IV pilus assembly protein [Gulosibacter faecalis]